MKYRRFTQDFKRSLIEQLLSEAATPTELCRRYNISSGQLYTWKRQYAQRKLDAEPSKEAELAAMVRELERLLCKLTFDNGGPLSFAWERSLLISLEAVSLFHVTNVEAIPTP